MAWLRGAGWFPLCVLENHVTSLLLFSHRPQEGSRRELDHVTVRLITSLRTRVVLTRFFFVRVPLKTVCATCHQVVASLCSFISLLILILEHLLLSFPLVGVFTEAQDLLNLSFSDLVREPDEVAAR